MAVQTRGGQTSPISVGGLNDLLSRLMSDYDQARAGREQRYNTGLQLMQDVLPMYAPGGAFDQAAMANFEQGKTGAMSSGMQNLISSGLSKTSNPAALERGYEQTVGTPFRLGLAAESQGRLAGAMQNIAGYMGNYQELAPDPATLTHLATGGFGALLSGDQLAANRQAQSDMQYFNQFPQAATKSPTSASSGGSSGGSGSSGYGSVYTSPFSNLSAPGGQTGGSSGGTASPIMFGNPMTGSSDTYRQDYAAEQKATAGLQPMSDALSMFYGYDDASATSGVNDVTMSDGSKIRLNSAGTMVVGSYSNGVYKPWSTPLAKSKVLGTG